MSTRRQRLEALLDRHGRTYADEAGITLRDTPAPLFQLLVLTSLLSANLAADLGLRTARALRRAGLRTPDRMADATDRERWQVLADARFLRKEQTAGQLGRLAEQVRDDHGGDLRRLRDDAGGDPAAVHRAVQRFTGIGAVGADIWCREAQAVWPSLRPWWDDRMGESARALDLPTDGPAMADLAGTRDLSRVGAALIRSLLADDAGEVRADA